MNVGFPLEARRRGPITPPTDSRRSERSGVDDMRADVDHTVHSLA